MRRSDREVTEFTDILSIVEKCEVLRIALIDGEKPYLVPLNFGYEADGDSLTLYMHSAGEGRKIDIIRKSPEVCFEMDCSFQLVKADSPCNWTGEYESVIGEGQISILEDPEAKKHAMDAIMKKYGFEGMPEYNPAALARTALLKIEVRQMTGKRHLMPHS